MLNVDIYYSIVKSKDELFNWRIEMERSKIENCIFIDLKEDFSNISIEKWNVKVYELLLY